MSNRLIVKAQVDETDIGKVKPGLRARINLDAYPQENLEARVDHVAYEAKTVSNVTVYEVDVAPQRVPDFLRSGMTANVVFLAASKRDALLLPAEAVRQDDGGASVLLPNPSGKRVIYNCSLFICKYGFKSSANTFALAPNLPPGIKPYFFAKPRVFLPASMKVFFALSKAS